MKERLLKIWCETLEIDLKDWEEIKSTGEIEIDSLMIIRFIVNVEDEFDVELDDELLLSGTDDIIFKVYNELEKVRKNDEDTH